MDGALEATKEADQKIRDAVVGGKNHNKSHYNDDDDNNVVGHPVVFEVHKIDGPVDTVEYINTEGSTDDLKTINYREDGESTWFF